jgi:hypothetical protein
MKTWLAYLALVATMTIGVPLAGAGTEERCTTLGSQCVGGEPMNTSTMWGGTSINWVPNDPFGRFINFDDSPSDTQLYPENPSISGGWENYCEQFRYVTTAAAESPYLPPGNILSYVFTQNGNAGVCHVGSHGTINEAPNVSYCIRHYRRWDANSHVPQNQNEQQKVMTIGGYNPTNGGASPYGFVTIQISMHTGGQIGPRFDGNFWRSDGGQSTGIGDLGNMNQCQGNYCRFEICLDITAAGVGQARYRMTPVTPGNNVSSNFTSFVGTNIHPEGMQTNAVGGGGDQMYAQCTDGVNNIPCVTAPGSGGPTFISYNSHYIVTHVRPMNSTFWPGPACEVEGGCTGVQPQPPVAPSNLRFASLLIPLALVTALAWGRRRA